MKIGSKLRYIYTLELTPKEYSLFYEGLRALAGLPYKDVRDDKTVGYMAEQLEEQGLFCANCGERCDYCQ